MSLARNVTQPAELTIDLTVSVHRSLALTFSFNAH